MQAVIKPFVAGARSAPLVVAGLVLTHWYAPDAEYWWVVVIVVLAVLGLWATRKAGHRG